MFETCITRLFGIRYPIIVGTMMHLARAEMVAAVSNAGALGVLASAIFQNRKDFRQEIQKIKSMTDKPFAVNLNLFPSRQFIDNREYLDVIVREGIKLVETSGYRIPDDLARSIKESKMIFMHKCVGIRYALKAQSLGADVITVVGYENGGATGNLDITTLCLVPRVVDSLKIPVIGGGGVSDGRGFLAVMSLGAQGVIIGTATLVAEECPIHPKLKQALIEASELDTMITLRSIQNAHRVWTNEAALRVAELEKRGGKLEEIIKAASGDKAQKMFLEGDLNAGTIACGQGVGLVKKVMPMKDIIERIIQQADELRQKLVAI